MLEADGGDSSCPGLGCAEQICNPAGAGSLSCGAAAASGCRAMAVGRGAWWGGPSPPTPGRGRAQLPEFPYARGAVAC